MVPKVSIIIVTTNGRRYIERCLQSVQELNYPDFEIIVSDNSSTDGTPELIRGKFPEVRLLCHQRNLGFAGANNAGMRVASGQYFFLLNDDTYVHPEILSVLVGAAENSAAIGVVGPKIYFYDESVVWYAGARIDWKRGEAVHLGRGMRDEELLEDRERDVDFITGAALLIKKEVTEKIGLLDETFFIYYEDADWCFKARRAGYRIVYVPFGGVWHTKSATTSTFFYQDLLSDGSNNSFIRLRKIILALHISGRFFSLCIRKVYNLNRNKIIFMYRYALPQQKMEFLSYFTFVTLPVILSEIFYRTPRAYLTAVLNWSRKG